MNIDETIAYINGKHATFTISSLDKRKHFTYKRWDKNGRRYISYLTRASRKKRRRKYTYLGILTQDMDLYPTHKSPDIDEPVFKVLNRALTWLRVGKMPPDGHIEHSDVCCMCGRELTDPESLDTGIGPVCGGRRNH